MINIKTLIINELQELLQTNQINYHLNKNIIFITSSTNMFITININKITNPNKTIHTIQICYKVKDPGPELSWRNCLSRSNDEALLAALDSDINIADPNCLDAVLNKIKQLYKFIQTNKIPKTYINFDLYPGLESYAFTE